MYYRELLNAEHDCTGFDCGKAQLNDWLHKHGLANQDRGIARTFVLVDGEGRVVGYYAMCASQIAWGESPTALRPNMPRYDVPMILLAKLAVDRNLQGAGLGTDLLVDAVRTCVEVAASIGVRGLKVDAIDQEAYDWYQKRGFRPLVDLSLWARLDKLARALEVAS